MPEIIPVESQQESLRRALPGAMKIYRDDPVNVACGLFRDRLGWYPRVVFTWTDSRQIVKGKELVTISAAMVGIPYTREQFDAADKLQLDTKGKNK